MKRLALCIVGLMAIPVATHAQQVIPPQNVSASAPQPVEGDLTDERIARVVRALLKSNPELVIEAATDYQQRKQVADRQAAQKRLGVLKPQIYDDPMAPVGGNPEGDVTVVEFFDYQCGYCKSVQPEVARLISEDKGVRIVYKEFPILGPASTTAARAALASKAQGKYEAFHVALMEQRGQLDDAVIFRLAQSVGLDVERLRSDMEAPEVAQALATNSTLAEKLGITGTPAFVAADQILPGAIKLDEMKQLVRRARTL